MGRIEELNAAIAAKKAEMDSFELDVDDYVGSYEEMLDESGPVVIAGMSYDVSHALKCVDETAYRCGLVDYVNSLDKDEDSKYKALCEELEVLENELADLESTEE